MQWGMGWKSLQTSNGQISGFPTEVVLRIYLRKTDRALGSTLLQSVDLAHNCL